jgi:hypothetical protein
MKATAAEAATAEVCAPSTKAPAMSTTTAAVRHYS